MEKKVGGGVLFLTFDFFLCVRNSGLSKLVPLKASGDKEGAVV